VLRYQIVPCEQARRPARAGHGSVRLAQPLYQRHNWMFSDRLRSLNRKESLI
jgi:hypothetical protein